MAENTDISANSVETNPQKFMSLFNDDSKWSHVKGVPVFDAHVEQYAVAGPDGQPQQITENFDQARLQQIVANCNRLVQQGSPIGLTEGHTADKGAEADQPRTLGYASNYRVANHPTLNRPCIFQDERYYPDKFPVAQELKYRSVERWRPGPATEGLEYFKPVALLKREPRRPLGPVAYQRSGHTVVRYSMNDSVETYAMPDDKKPADAAPPKADKPPAPSIPDAPPPAAPPMPPAAAAPPAPAMPAPTPGPVPPVSPPLPVSAMEPSDQDKQLFAALCKMHAVPYTAPGMPAGGAPAQLPPMGGAEPQPPMPPMQNAMGSPSGSNVAPPMMPPVKPPEVPKMSADTASVERYQAELQNANQRIYALERDNRIERYHRTLQALAREVEMDIEEELVDLQDATQQQFEARVSRMKKRYAKAPNAGGPIRLGEMPDPVEGDKKGRVTDRETMNKVHRYQAEHPGTGYADACEKVLRGDTNGSVARGA